MGYNAKDFLEIQLRQIRMGEEAGLDVEVYAKPEYDWFQMEEIRKGLEAKLDVSSFADPAISFDRMREIRIALEKGIDVTCAVQYSAGVIREFRKAFLSGVNISKYIDEGYDGDQLQQIRLALESQIDIEPYLQRMMRDVAIQEIRRGLAAGLDVSIYADLDHDWRQMREIRMGMEARLDYKLYMNPMFDWHQMEEIRKGLEAGINARSYASLMYPYKEMRKKRLRLLQHFQENPAYGINVPIDQLTAFAEEAKKNGFLMEEEDLPKKPSFDLWDEPAEKETSAETAGTPQAGRGMQGSQGMQGIQGMPGMPGMPGSPLVPGMQKLGAAGAPAGEQRNSTNFHVTLRNAEMEAYLTVYTGDMQIGRQDIMDALEKNRVTHGILESIVEEILEGKHEKEPVLIAKGQIPRMGQNGWYEYFFRTTIDRRPKTLKDGSVDYQNIEWFESVTKGQKIAFYHPAQAGVDGYTVTGRPMPAKKGREEKIITGKGFVLDADKQTYRAATSGTITMTDFVINISRELTVDEVTIASGNIVFDGSVHVKGNVGDGVSIRAADDVLVDGCVGAAQIVCNGKLLIKQGIAGGYRAVVRAKQGITSKFFEAAEIFSQGDVQAQDSLNAKIHTQGKIIINKSLAGGMAYAEKGYILRDVGNRAGLPTSLTLGYNPELMQKKRKLDKEISEIDQQKSELLRNMDEFKAKYPPEVRNGMEVFLKMESAVFTLEQQKMATTERRNAMERELEKINASKIEIKGSAFEGLKVDVGGNIWRANNQYNITIRSVGSRLDIIRN